MVVRNREGVDTLIPNENLITSEVINWSYADRNVRIIIKVQISYSDDPEKAMALMLDCAKASDRVLDTPEPTVRLMAFGDNGIELQLRVWIADPENGTAQVKSDINLGIWRAFKAHGITIPFPRGICTSRPCLPWIPGRRPGGTRPEDEIPLQLPRRYCRGGGGFGAP